MHYARGTRPVLFRNRFDQLPECTYPDLAMQPSVTPLLVFVVCYGLFVLLPQRRALVACAGAVALVLLGTLGWREALFGLVQWNVIGLFFGTLILAELFLQSRMPAVIAERLVDRAKTARAALLTVCGISAFLSMFVENVAVVMLLAPVAFSLADKLQIPPARLLIAIAVCSNLEGTATLIGDPPSMILAGYMGMTFNDFFVYQGRPGIFFAVQIGAVAGFGVLAYVFRSHRAPVALIRVERVRSWIPTVLIAALILGLSATTYFDPEFRWLAGTLTLVLAAAGLAWYRLRGSWRTVFHMTRRLDWDTTLFLVGVFVVVGALSESGWLSRAADWISGHTGSHVFGAFALIVVLAVLLSGFVDNVPFLIAMIPITRQVADHLQMPVPLLMFGLLVGACLGGNITPIGASANLAAVGLLRKRGAVVTFREFMAVGVPFTAAAVVSAAAFIWVVWHP